MTAIRYDGLPARDLLDSMEFMKEQDSGSGVRLYTICTEVYIPGIYIYYTVACVCVCVCPLPQFFL